MATKSPPDLGSVSQETVLRLERQERQREASGIGDLLPVIADNVGPEIARAEQERDALVAKVRALNLKIATLRTHQLVGVNNGDRQNGGPVPA